MKYIYEPLGPSDRLNQEEEAPTFDQETIDQVTKTPRERALAAAAKLALEHTEGCEVTEVLTGQRQGNSITWAFRHDPDISYQVIAIQDFRVGTSQQTTWTFDTERLLPIRDGITARFSEVTPRTWEEVEFALNTISGELEARSNPSLVPAEA